MLVSGDMLVDQIMWWDVCEVWCMTCGTQGVWVMLLEGCYNMIQKKTMRIKTYWNDNGNIFVPPQ